MGIAALHGCLSCGTEAPAGARVCPGCGAELAESPEIRKTVSILFCDWVDSTSLGSGLDAESLRRVQESFYAEARRVLERHGGTVEKFIGDAVMAVFGIPQAHEDDALRAARAAVELREALASLNARLEKELDVRLEVRTAVNTGEVVAASDPSAGQTFVTGDPVVVAKRLEEAATSGEILIGEATRCLVRDAALVEVADDVPAKGRPEPLVAWRLLAVINGAPPFARRLEAPLVGRERELALLRQAFERAASDAAGCLFTVLGAAGVGKSRLVRELAGETGDRSAVLVGRCLPYGDGITFWPLVDVVRRAAKIGNHLDAASARARIAELVAAEPEAELVADRLAAAVGLLDAQASTEETFWAVRKLLNALARRRPVVLVFDDLQWAEPTFLDLVEHLAECIRDLPVLVVCLARLELLEERPAWAGGWPNASTIMLEPLREPECGELVDGLLGAGSLPDETKQEIAAASEGNPLFVEELLAMLIEDEVLRRESGRWLAGDLSSLRVPPTIQALLGARLDRLGRRERSVLEVASVAGRSFSRDAVAELIDEPGLDVLLGALVRSQLLAPELPAFGADAYRFRHLLIRDAAYAATPKERRAHLHERHAGWLERRHGDRLGEVEEIVGYHLEQAHCLRSELGRANEHLAARAGERLSAAGQRALGRGDISAAANLLGRGAALLPAAAPERTELLPELGSALVLAGEFEQAEAVLTEAIERAAATRNRRIELHAQLERAFLRSLTGPEGSVEELRRISERAIPQLESLGDDLGLTKAWRRIADVHWMTNRWNEQERALERALVHAERAGDAREAAGALMRIALALYYGPVPAPAAISRAEEILDRARGTRAVESTFIVSLAGLQAMSGRFDEARELFARGRAIVDELGLKVWLAGFSLVASDIEMLAGDPGTAEAHLRAGYEALHGMGDRGLLSTVAAALARAIYAQGRYEEAERFTEISEELDGRGDIASQIGWRATRAKVLAQRHDFEHAESLAREAAAIAERTDDLAQRGRALLDLAEVLELAHRDEEAAQLVETARDLFEQKGNTVVAEETRELLARLRA